MGNSVKQNIVIVKISFTDLLRKYSKELSQACAFFSLVECACGLCMLLLFCSLSQRAVSLLPILVALPKFIKQKVC